ncbi:hypothetical protein [Aquabacterium sp.]|uniref:hypothetical protein n=1 Tax=Aquabacterium sp. TaxID=1872578 RepID=UPI0035C78492
MSATADDRDPAELVNIDRLPPMLRRLCRAMGSRKAFELCKHRGGVPLQVPAKASLDHWLVSIIGIDGLQRLVDAFGGELIDVPKYDKVLMQLQHQQVHACLMAGMGPTRTALKTGYTKRHVLNIQADLLEAQGERYSPPEHARAQQCDLFAELLVPTTPDEYDDHDFDAMEEAAVAEQEAAIESIDEEHREVAVASINGAHNPFGLGFRS